MDLYSIKLFLAIAERKSLSGAAQVLHFAQPTVSEQLARLEKELGVQLVVREKGSRRAILTSAGRAFLPIAQQYRDLQKSLDDDITQFKLTQSHKIFRLVAGISDQLTLVPDIMRKLMQTAPDTRLHLKAESFLTHIKDDFAFHAAIVSQLPDKTLQSPFYEALPFFREGHCLLCPADTPLEDRTLSPEELDPAYEVLVPNLFTKTWRLQHLPQDTIPYCTASNYLAAHSYLTDPRCWCLMPARMAHKSMAEHPGQLTIRQVDPEPEPRCFNLLISKAMAEDEVMQLFLRCCQETLAEQPYLEKLLP